MSTLMASFVRAGRGYNWDKFEGVNPVGKNGETLEAKEEPECLDLDLE